jgi:BA14K-like protein
MRSRMIVAVTALVFASSLASAPVFAQGRNVNDGGMPAEPVGAPQYSGSGQVVPAPGNEAGGSGNDCAARFHSYDPATGTYMGLNGQRHRCP